VDTSYLEIAAQAILQLSIPLAQSAFLGTLLGWAVARLSVGPKRASRCIAFCNMFGLYGVVLGFIIGSSKDSLARDAFSTTVTLFSGYFGYLISKEMNPRLKAMIPAAIICFLVSLLLTLTFIAKIKEALAVVPA
jgi:hypothetical protein